MMKSKLWLPVLVLSLGVAGCSKEPPPPPAPVADNTDDAAARAAREAAERARLEAEAAARREAEERARLEMEAARATLAEMVFFDYDEARIRPEAQAILDQKARILRQYPDVRLRIEGHCDERGSNEYNDALGSRRATSIRQYLEGAGIGSLRLEIVSFGEDRPMASGHDESAWARNRRGEFRILSGLGG